MPDYEKKRKRHGDIDGRPEKRFANGASISRAKLSWIESSDELGPVIASTPGLDFPSNIHLQAFQRLSPNELLLHSSQHPKLDYTATEEHDGSADNLLKHYVGVYDPNTGEVKITEVRKVTVRTTLRSEIDELREERERIARLQRPTMTSRRQALGMEFGTKKSKKAIADLTENAVIRNKDGRTDTANDDHVAASVLKSMAENAKDMPTKKEHQAQVDENKPRPKANLAAETPADVYPISTVVGKDTMASINVKDWVDAVGNNNKVSVTSRFVASRIQTIAKSGDIKKLKVLRYLLNLIDFHAALKTVGRGPSRLPQKDKLPKNTSLNPPIFETLRRRFAEGNEMTRWHVDNLLTHVAAAALLIDDFELDVHELREDLRIDNKTIKQYFHELGARVGPPTETERTKMKITKAESINHSMAKLKLPLEFPKAKSFQGKRR